MTDHAHSEARSELALLFRWLLLVPIFAVLVILAANFTLGFFGWLGGLEGWSFYLMLPVSLLVVLSNAFPPLVTCLVAPRIRPTVTLLGLGHFAGFLYGITQFELTLLSTLVWGAHSVVVYLTFFAVYFLDLLHSREAASDAT